MLSTTHLNFIFLRMLFKQIWNWIIIFHYHLFLPKSPPPFPHKGHCWLIDNAISTLVGPFSKNQTALLPSQLSTLDFLILDRRKSCQKNCIPLVEETKAFWILFFRSIVLYWCWLTYSFLTSYSGAHIIHTSSSIAMVVFFCQILSFNFHNTNASSNKIFFF